MTSPVQAAIEAGDAAGLKALLEAEPALADAVIRWGEGGKNGSVPLHYVCDMVFEGPLETDKALPLVEVLLAAGAEIDAPHERHGDTPLIAAASLYNEPVGLRLIKAGADVTARGLFGATALHWAAHCGLPDLTAALIEAGAEAAARDREHDATPAEWAWHGWSEGSERDRGGLQPSVIVHLAAAGAPMDYATSAERDPEWLAALGDLLS